jgi:hypothetical protein
MKTKQFLATLEYLAAMHEARGAADNAAALRAFKKAIGPLAVADIKLLVAALTCGQSVDNKAK